MVGDLEFARSQMAFTLGFHIIFAVLGIGIPVLMAFAERRWLRTRDPMWKELAQRWGRATAILFAVGAVSGTALSFELGLLWPEFMARAGPVFGLPFALEGFAFFVEAIFLGVYLYGWDKIPDRAHWWSGVLVAVSGAMSAVFVVTANAWMNTPKGFRVAEDGSFVDIDPIAAMLNPAAPHEVVHMMVAAYAATGFALAGIHAYYLLKGRHPELHRRGLTIALAMAVLMAPLTILTGHWSAEQVAEEQPAKFAAMEGHYETGPCAPLRIGGYADDAANRTRYAVEVPCGLSLLAHRDPDANVTGLTEFPADERPRAAIVHLAFDVMVAAGFVMLGVAAWAAWRWFRDRTVPTGRGLLKTLVAVSPLGFVAIEAGWVVTEVGRQPWIIQGVMRTEESVTPMPGLVAPFLVFLLLYLVLGAMAWYLMRRQFGPPEDRTAAPDEEAS